MKAEKLYCGCVVCDAGTIFCNKCKIKRRESCEFEQAVYKFKQDQVSSLLDQCTKRQKDLFYRIHGHLHEIRDNSLKTAYYQCKRTLILNKEK